MTPGPWRIGSTRASRVVSIEAGVNGYSDGPAHVIISGADLSPEDGALIAAAPDLLAALEQVRLRAIVGGGQLSSIIEAAIAKARGGR